MTNLELYNLSVYPNFAKVEEMFNIEHIKGLIEEFKSIRDYIPELSTLEVRKSHPDKPAEFLKQSSSDILYFHGIGDDVVIDVKSTLHQIVNMKIEKLETRLVWLNSEVLTETE